MKNKSIILFDGVCNLCNFSVQFVLKHEKENTLFFSSLQSNFGQQFLKENQFDAQDLKTIIFVNEGKVYKKSKAIFQIAKFLKFPFNILQYLHFIPTIISDFFYNIISKNRYKLFGKSETCHIPSKDLSNRFIN